MVLGYAQNGIELARNDDKTLTGNINFNVAYSYSNPIWSPETYLSLPIYTSGNVITGGLQEKFSRNVEVFDSEIGDFIQFETENYTRNQQVLNIKAHNLTAIYNLRRFLDYLKGKYTAFWMPSSNVDLVAYDQITSGNTSFKVYYGNWTNNPISYIRVTGSSTANFQVTAIGLNADGTESFTISPTPTVTITNITKIEILTKVRLNSDSIAIEHEPKLTAGVKTQLIEVKS